VGRVLTYGFSRYLVPLGLLLVGIILTLAVWQVVRQQEYGNAKTEFDLLFNHTLDTIQDRIKANTQVLRGVEGMFSANHKVGRDVSRAEFKAYIESLKLDERYPGIQGVGFSKLIRPVQLDNHLRTIRAEGFPRYALRPLGERNLYSSIIYLEPFDWRNQRAFGYDMYSEPVRQRAMERARKTGVATMSGRVTLVQEIDKEVQPGVLLYLPIYRGGATPSDEDQRLNELVGWAYSPLRMKDMISNLIERDLPSIKGQIAFSIYDGEIANPATLLFSTEEAGRDQASPFHTSRQMEIAGQSWFLTATAPPDIHVGESTVLTRLVLAIGLSISLLLAFISLMQIRNAARLAVESGRLQKSEARFRHFFEKNKSVMLLIEPTSGAIIEANQAAAKYYGFEQHLLIGMNITDINVLPPEEVALERQRALHEERNYFNFRHRIASGELRDVEVYSTPVEVNGKSLLFSIIHDVTGRKNLERQKLAEREHMVAIERMSSLGTMVGGVAHEINNPLMGVINYVEFARDKAADEKSKEVLDSALHEINRIKTIVQNMMVFVRVDSTTTALCNVTEAVDQTVALLDGELQKHAIQVSVELADGLPQVKCNLGSLEQVLVNLLLNARDAVAEQAERRITIKGVCEDEKVVITVCDNGPGIKEEALTSIFVPFFTTKPAGKGTGLGLAVSRQLVEKYGGSLRLQDEIEVGACFRLELDKV
jgi:PAS domain S-box-containing protein